MKPKPKQRQQLFNNPALTRATHRAHVRDDEVLENDYGAPSGGLKLMTVFIIVLALHVLVIGGISTYHVFFSESGDAIDEIVSDTDTELEDLQPAIEPAVAPKNRLPVQKGPVFGLNEDPVAPIRNVSQSGEKIEPAGKPRHPSNAIARLKVPTTLATEVPGPGAEEVVTVQSGDTLFGLARRHNTSVSELKELNALDSSILKVGQKLKVPNGAPTQAVENRAVAQNEPAAPSRVASQTEANRERIFGPNAAAGTAAPKPSATVVAGGGSYTVQSGDTLSRIARRFNTSISQIVALNGMTDPNQLKVGDTLKLPVAGSRGNSTAPQSSNTRIAKERPSAAGSSPSIPSNVYQPPSSTIVRR